MEGHASRRRSEVYLSTTKLGALALITIAACLYSATFVAGLSNNAPIASSATKYTADIYDGDSSPLTDTVLTHADTSKSDRVEMTARDGRKFTCRIPHDIPEEGPASVLASSLPPVSSVLAPLTSNCLYRIEGWWTYEVCYGRHVAQFHQEGEQRVANFVLGRKLSKSDHYDEDEQEHTHEETTQREGGEGEEAAPTKKEEEMVLLGSRDYYDEQYFEGTKCDITGEARSAELHFYCNPISRVGAITSIKEPLSCHYVVTVETSLLCAHPLYAKPEKVALPIICLPNDANYSKNNIVTKLTPSHLHGVMEEEEEEEPQEFIEKTEAEVRESMVRLASKIKEIKNERSEGASIDKSQRLEEAIAAAKHIDQSGKTTTQATKKKATPVEATKTATKNSKPPAQATTLKVKEKRTEHKPVVPEKVEKTEQVKEVEKTKQAKEVDNAEHEEKVADVEKTEPAEQVEAEEGEAIDIML